METRKYLLSELMIVEQRKARIELETEQLAEREKFLKQELKIGAAETDEDDEAPVKNSKKAKPVVDDDDDDDMPLATTKKGAKKAAVVDDDEDDEDDAPAKKTSKGASSTGKKGGKKAEALDPLSDEDDEADLDEALGTDDDDGPKAIGDEDIRKTLNKIIESKGADGKKKARAVMVKYTRDRSGLVKDIMKGSHSKIYAELKKI